MTSDQRPTRHPFPGNGQWERLLQPGIERVEEGLAERKGGRPAPPRLRGGWGLRDHRKRKGEATVLGKHRDQNSPEGRGRRDPGRVRKGHWGSACWDPQRRRKYSTAPAGSTTQASCCMRPHPRAYPHHHHTHTLSCGVGLKSRRAVSSLPAILWGQRSGQI